MKLPRLREAALSSMLLLAPTLEPRALADDAVKVDRRPKPVAVVRQRAEDSNRKLAAAERAAVKSEPVSEDTKIEESFYKSLIYGQYAKELVTAGILKGTEEKIADFDKRMQAAVEHLKSDGIMTKEQLAGVPGRFTNRFIWLANRTSYLENQEIEGKKTDKAAIVEFFINYPELAVVGSALNQIELSAKAHESGKEVEKYATPRKMVGSSVIQLMSREHLKESNGKSLSDSRK